MERYRVKAAPIVANTYAFGFWSRCRTPRAPSKPHRAWDNGKRRTLSFITIKSINQAWRSATHVSIETYNLDVSSIFDHPPNSLQFHQNLYTTGPIDNLFCTFRSSPIIIQHSHILLVVSVYEAASAARALASASFEKPAFAGAICRRLFLPRPAQEEEDGGDDEASECCPLKAKGVTPDSGRLSVVSKIVAPLHISSPETRQRFPRWTGTASRAHVMRDA